MGALLAYEWDIFLSYPRSGNAGQWVHNHFLPVLTDCLDSQLAHKPRIFVDTAQPTGVEWPENLKHALQRSRLLVAVWTPPYFRSSWCTAEWMSMIEREKVVGESGLELQRGLVYPIVYSDGKHFAERAKATQYRRDLSAFSYPYPTFRESELFLNFHDAITSIAQEIEEHLDLVPDWQPNWPIVVPGPGPSQGVALARL